ncbi:hypothetical protein [Pseudoalteromonas sp. APC 3691]|uniref:hypothetical protein n=1 Tax=Pseudoalteromonas sp. APC 3691 TaxID=3035173 RepID=UPI0025B5AE45|nr:hypothetical protein [Pseudoalteromonas sp. APC 3691]MDN3390153.1 hypothetical protein [Pseudoalteromonas sp. APC 3691]
MNKTEKKIFFADSLPDFDYEDEVYEYFENEFIKKGNLCKIVETINIAIVVGCIDNLNESIELYRT